jgi:NAD(P)-dependent dehydrogenase (short-subunit alcohol dehydrogenase family)
MLLAGKKVVVVGGSSGNGLATAEMAKREGADVIIASRNVERLDRAAEKLNAIAIPADVTSDDSVVDLFRRCGPVDHVVVTAAAAHRVQDGCNGRCPRHDEGGKFWGA